MVSTLSPNSFNLEELDTNQLLSAAFSLIDIAPLSQLKDCYENIFKREIMKFILKQVIKQEIQDISEPIHDHWKRVCLVQKLNKLKCNEEEEDEEDTNTSEIAENQNKSLISTDQLLLAGYLRNINKNTQYPFDIFTICHQYIENCSNIVPQNKIILFDHNGDQSGYQQLFSFRNQRNICAQVSDKKYQDITAPKLLLSPYKIFVNDVHRPWVYTVSSQHSEAKTVYTNTNSMASYSNQGKNGVVQYLDVPRDRLLHFGGDSRMFATWGIFAYDLKATVDVDDDDDAQSDAVSLYGSIARSDIGSDIGSDLKATVDVDDDDDDDDDDYDAHDYDFRERQKKKTRNWRSWRFWEEVGEMNSHKGFMSICKVSDSKLAIIGGQKFGNRVGNVEMYDLEQNESIDLVEMNHKRRAAGSYYNQHSNEIVVFGGDGDGYNECKGMEIYDCHKHIWWDLPYLTKNEYNEYPFIWSVGGQCIFVAQTTKTDHENKIECEWIDFRECNEYGKVDANFRQYIFSEINDLNADNFSLFSL